MQIIIFERALAPTAEMKIQIRAGSDAAALAVIHVQRALEFLIQEPGVIAQQKRAEPAAVTGNEIEVIYPVSQVA